jgi:hypothetical protein
MQSLGFSPSITGGATHGPNWAALPNICAKIVLHTHLRPSSWALAEQSQLTSKHAIILVPITESF